MDEDASAVVVRLRLPKIISGASHDPRVVGAAHTHLGFVVPSSSRLAQSTSHQCRAYSFLPRSSSSSTDGGLDERNAPMDSSFAALARIGVGSNDDTHRHDSPNP
jgi:hypothetical protein